MRWVRNPERYRPILEFGISLWLTGCLLWYWRQNNLLELLWQILR